MELYNVPQSRDRGRGLVLGMEAGQVVCPNRGVLDVEVCYTCRRFRGVTGSLQSFGIRCAGPTSAPAVSFLTLLTNQRS